MCWNTQLYSVFWTSTKNCPKKWQNKRGWLFTFCKTQAHKKKKTFCCNPPLDQTFVCFQLVLFETKHIDVEQKKHNLKKKAKIRKGISKIEQDGKPKKKRKDWWKNFGIEYFDGVPFMKQKQRRQKNRERGKNKQPKESKIKWQEERKKITRKWERERERERQIKRN